MKKIFIIAIFIRLICLYLFRNVINYDLESYLSVGELTLKGVNIYPNFASLHHPYLPFFLYIEAMAVYFGQSKIIVIAIIKIINIIFDLGILYLVYLLSNKNLKTALIYAINPVTILVTTLHGQFDVIPLFFVLLTVYLIKIRKEGLSILSFSFAILTKTWPALFLIPILRKASVCHPRENGDPEDMDSRSSSLSDVCLRVDDLRGNDRKVVLLILIGTFPILFTVLYCLLFKTNLVDIGKTLISYQGLWGIWGPWALFSDLRLRWQLLTTLIFLISFFIYSYLNSKKDLTKNILKLLFFFFVFTTNFSIQYFVWLIPFLVLIKPKKYLWLVILMTLYLFSFYFLWLFNLNLTNLQNIIGFILWLSFIKIGYPSTRFTRSGRGY